VHVLTRPLVLACLAGIVFAAFGGDPAAQSFGASTYIDVLERYQRGDDDAIGVLASLDARAIEAGERAVTKEFQEAPTAGSRGTRLLRTAIVAHTDAAISARAGPAVVPWSPHLSTAQRYAQRLAAKNREDSVAVGWWLIAIGTMHGQRNYSLAMKVARDAVHACGERPEFLLAAGITNELAWVWEHEEDIRSPFNGSLEEAEKTYARLVAQQPALVEARVRLGRVQTLRGDHESAVRTLADVPESGAAVLLSLARLFEGDALERQGRIADAQQRYEAAARLAPAAQAAQLAFAYTQYQGDARTDAAARVREFAANRAAPDNGDPWFWYSLGLAWVVRPQLDMLRALVRR
jgi:hypothetical protein